MRDPFDDTPLLNPSAMLDGIRVDADDADPASRSGYTCEECGEPMILKLSSRDRPFFSHLGETDCAGGLETSLHREAKQVFARHRSLKVPSCEIWHKGRSLRVLEACTVDYYDVLVESRTSKIRPDVSLMREGDCPLLIEIAVSHRVDYRKRRRLKDLNYPCLELRVGELFDHGHFDRERLEKTLIEDDTDRFKHWVYTPDQDKYKAQIAAELQDEERERLLRIEREFADIDRCARQKNLGRRLQNQHRSDAQ